MGAATIFVRCAPEVYGPIPMYFAGKEEGRDEIEREEKRSGKMCALGPAYQCGDIGGGHPAALRTLSRRPFGLRTALPNYCM